MVRNGAGETDGLASMVSAIQRNDDDFSPLDDRPVGADSPQTEARGSVAVAGSDLLTADEPTTIPSAAKRKADKAFAMMESKIANKEGVETIERYAQLLKDTADKWKTKRIAKLASGDKVRLRWADDGEKVAVAHNDDTLTGI